jgi:hypothetical protein
MFTARGNRRFGWMFTARGKRTVRLDVHRPGKRTVRLDVHRPGKTNGSIDRHRPGKRTVRLDVHRPGKRTIPWDVHRPGKTNDSVDRHRPAGRRSPRHGVLISIPTSHPRVNTRGYGNAALRAPPPFMAHRLHSGKARARHPGRPRKASPCCDPCRRFLSSCSSPSILAGRQRRSRLRLPLRLYQRRHDPSPRLKLLLRLQPRCLPRLRPRHPRRRLRLRRQRRSPLRLRQDRPRVSGASPPQRPLAMSRSSSTGRAFPRA